MTFSLLSAAALLLAGALTGLLTGVWWCVGYVLRAQEIYKQAKAAAVIGEMTLALIRAELDKEKAAAGGGTEPAPK